MLETLGINVLSNFIFVILGILIVTLLNHLFHRKKLLNFFIVTDSRRLVIYLSNVKVKRGGATGVDGTLFSYSGPALAYEESLAANKLKAIFPYLLPGIDKPDYLNKLIISDVEVEIRASPDDETVIEEDASLIVIGLPAYNIVSKYAEKKWSWYAKYDQILVPNKEKEAHESDRGRRIIPSQDNVGTAVPLSKSEYTQTTSPSAVSLSATEYSSNSYNETRVMLIEKSHPSITIQNIPPYTDSSIGFVQRIFDNQNQRNIFYIAGLSENSTAGGVYYLIKNWSRLNKKYGTNNQFLVLLQVSETNNKSSVVILEKE